MNNGNLIVRNNSDKKCSNIKISRSIIDNFNIYEPSKKVLSRKILCTNENNKIQKLDVNCKKDNFPKIAIKKEQNCNSVNSEVVLVNGCWDTSNKIPNIIAEMHNVTAEDFQLLQKACLFNQSDQLNDSRDIINPSPKGSDSGIESDCTDGNLSWLLNYKIHELPPVPDTSSAENSLPQSSSSLNDAASKTHYERLYQVVPRIIDTKNIKDDTRHSDHSYRYSGPKKPPFTYTELIEHALNEKGELTVSGIYRWISDHFPFYKQNDDRWKNSVRHNLSINPHFRKGGKAVHGAGHLWTIAQKDEKKAWQIKQRMQQFIQSSYKDMRNLEQNAFDEELKAATESILSDPFSEIDEGDEKRRKDDVEIEYINFIDVPTGLEDFLSPPVSKQEIVQECGLGSDFFITDINPNALGLNLPDGEQMGEDGIYDEMNFEYYDNMQKE